VSVSTDQEGRPATEIRHSGLPAIHGLDRRELCRRQSWRETALLRSLDRGLGLAAFRSQPAECMAERLRSIAFAQLRC
jgi:hypothetical protein